MSDCALRTSTLDEAWAPLEVRPTSGRRREAHAPDPQVPEPHVLFVNGRFPQYSQTFVHDQIKALKRRGGGAVTVFARARAPFRFENSAPECDRGMLYAKPVDARLVLRAAAGALRHPRRAAKLVALRRRGLICPATFWLAAQLGRAPDIVLTHFGTNFRFGVELKRHVFPHARNVVVFHGHDVSSFVQKEGWEPYRKAAPLIDAAICVNRKWAELLQRNTGIRTVRTIYLGTEIHHRPRVPNGDENAFSLLFVGRFTEKKGFDDLFAAVKAARLLAPRPLRVHCVGDGPLLAEFRRRARIEGAGEAFVFYGARQKSFVRQLMAECDLLVAPSRTASDGDCEGLPVVLMEAMAAGIPVVSTEHSGIPELVTSGETGLLVPEADPAALEAALLFAVENPRAMAAMAEKARAHVAIAHDEITQAEILVDALKDLP